MEVGERPTVSKRSNKIWTLFFTLTCASAVLPHEHRALVRESEHDWLRLPEHAGYENHSESAEVGPKVGTICIVASCSEE